MTKKDYQKAAEIVQADKEENGDIFSKLMEQSFVKLFQADNPRFDEERFRFACNRKVK
jgi:hypothetical protein